MPNASSGSNDKRRVHLGIDVGSVSVNFAVLDDHKHILLTEYRRHKGQPLQTAYQLLREGVANFDDREIATLSITGTAGKRLADLLGLPYVNEIISQAKATEFLTPQVNTIVEIGGEDSKLILLSAPDEEGKRSIEDFAMNTICAAGTGSFLDQQASRLGVSIEGEFGKMAMRSVHPPRIAGRCSVFAKTDMIHLQQEATSDYDIVAGLCFAMARNFKATIAKGKSLVPPISFQGGVAANLGMRRAFKEVLDLPEDQFIVPEQFANMGAIGAVLCDLERGNAGNYTGLKPLADYLSAPKEIEAGHERLVFRPESYNTGQVYQDFKPGEVVDAFMGIDVGSISTNVVVTDREGRVLSKRYLMTAGRPIEAVRQGIEEVGQEIREHVRILGVGTTGSGRYLTGDFVGADVVRNEITAQARGAAHFDPTVDTIFEIGGQDSKFISLENGAVVDFEMNKVCAAGTGSFLEEQAEKLSLNIKEEFASLALSAESPCKLGERCTVFMESDLVHHQQQGATRDNLVSGLAYSIVTNYLNRVVQNKRIGKNIFFQGGTAFNHAVIAAFEAVTGKKVTVPPHHDVTGAIGMALIAGEEYDGKTPSRFRGFDISKLKYELSSFECADCANHCEIRKVAVDNNDGTKSELFYGSRCEKYEIKEKEESRWPNMFVEREKLLNNIYDKKVDPDKVKGKVGIPRMLWYYELYPFWKAFFTELGYEVVRSKPTNKTIIHNGVESVSAESCFPVKVAHGHIIDLMDKKVDFILMPSHITMFQDNARTTKSYVCPYVQTAPYVIEGALGLKEKGIEMLTPIIFFERGKKYLYQEMGRFAKRLGVSRSAIKRAVDAAMEYQVRFFQELPKLGEKALSLLGADDSAIVIVSRPYNGCDPGVNLDLPKKLMDLGVMSIPMDCLPVNQVELADEWDNMYWKYGQKILSAVELIRDNPKLYALYITNFGCGPDSFITKFFRYRMTEKPYLQIEVDEHAADVGAITRCEAFLDSLNNIDHSKGFTVKPVSIVTIKGTSDHRTIWIPNMADHAYGVRAAFLANGISAEVIPPPDDESLEWGRQFTTGKECYPAILTTGDMVKLLKDPKFDADHAAFFMPSGTGPCRFGQYNMLQRLVLQEMGMDHIPIYSPNQGRSLYDDLGVAGTEFTRRAWWGLVATDYLEKLMRQIRAYEISEGSTGKVYWKYVMKVHDVIAERKPLDDVVRVCREGIAELTQVPSNRTGERPRVGIVGEIYVRSNRYANNDVVREVERLGGEVWMPPIAEWFLYTNHTRKLDARVRSDYRTYLKNVLTEWVQMKDEHKIAEPFKDVLINFHEPPISETIAAAAEYIHSSFEGEAILSIGKSVDFARNELDGVINVMPFTCMPGTIVSAILKKFKAENDNIPVLNMAYDGLEESNDVARLEAFIYQAKQFKERRERKKKGREKVGVK